MASVIDVCNLALSHLGAYAIQALSDNVKEAKESNRLYPFARDAVLRDHDWNFASARATLALSTETVTGWTYAYGYPVDCIAAREIVDPNKGGVAQTDSWGNDNTSRSPKIPYEISLNAAKTSRLILTNQETAELRYTAKITDPNLFDSLFIDALAFRLAADLAQPLRGSPQLVQMLVQMYTMKISKAKSENAGEGRADPDHSCTFLEARN
jgi:hypothetical protein